MNDERNEKKSTWIKKNIDIEKTKQKKQQLWL